MPAQISGKVCVKKSERFDQVNLKVTFDQVKLKAIFDQVKARARFDQVKVKAKGEVTNQRIWIILKHRSYL